MELASSAFGSKGEPIIILHGLFGSRENWQSVAQKLAVNFRVFTVDQRNHGDSPHSFEMDYAMMAADLLEFLETQGLPQAHILGHSMGAKTAMQFALNHAQRVRSLIAVDMSPRANSPRHEAILEGMLSLNPAGLTTRQQMEEQLAPWVPELALRRFLLKNVRRTAQGFRWRLGLQEISRNYRHLNQAVTGPPFEGPTLFIRGADSDYLTSEDEPVIKSLFRKARIQAVPHAGHLVHVENPDVFLRQVTDFLTFVA